MCGEKEGEKRELGVRGGGGGRQPCSWRSSPAPVRTPRPCSLSFKASQVANPPGVLQWCGENRIFFFNNLYFFLAVCLRCSMSFRLAAMRRGSSGVGGLLIAMASLVAEPGL